MNENRTTLTPSQAAYVESKPYTIREPADLSREIGRAFADAWHIAYYYEHRHIDVHYPTRLCPSCQTVQRLEVAVDSFRERGWRCCPDCGELGVDSAAALERREVLMDNRARRGSLAPMLVKDD